MKPRSLLFIALVALPLPARADAPALTVDQVVARARAVREKRPSEAVCHVEIESQLADKNGKVEHSDKRDGTATLRGNDIDIVTAHAWRDGKPLGADELATERKKSEEAKRKSKKGEDLEIVPLAAKNASEQTFELVRQESLWGRPAYVLAVHAQPSSGNGSLATGTLWIDAESFVELKGELSPHKLPPNADWVKVQEQFTLGPGGASLPTFLRIEGGGHMLFIKKQFRSTLRWSDCHGS
jgi:hypothetical protein